MSETQHRSVASLFPPRFATARLNLRPLTACDRDTVFHGWASDPVATRYLTFPTATSAATVESFLERVALRWAEQTAFDWLITEAATGEAVGAISARIQGPRVELGYVLRVSSWNRGYMTEVLRELVRLAFAIPGVHRVSAVCDVDNAASARVMEKAGLVREGLLRAWNYHPNVSPHPRDCWSFSLARGDFETSRSLAHTAEAASPTGTNARIRAVIPADAEAWRELRGQLWPEGAGEHAAEIAAFFAGKTSEPVAVLVAEDPDGSLVGLVELSVRRDYVEGSAGGPVAYLEGWFVVPSRRGLGLGRELGAQAEHWAAEAGFKELASDAESDNVVGIRAHQACGFRLVSTNAHFIKPLVR